MELGNKDNLRVLPPTVANVYLPTSRKHHGVSLSNKLPSIGIGYGSDLSECVYIPGVLLRTGPSGAEDKSAVDLRESKDTHHKLKRRRTALQEQ